MIMSANLNPKYSLYYIGGIILRMLQQERSLNINTLVENILKEYDYNINIEYIYYSVDYLYLMSLIKADGGYIELC